ncbi:serine hydrolase domain-containing protein [Streptomyces sp. NPDC002574]|uniref:serine hydrolase domain-containing protein n=1 Tax=Streptomyces sp. NPDC002574 TaxID=3364652 RepID=UPI0036C5A078
MTPTCARPPRNRSNVSRAIAVALAAAALPTALACGGPTRTDRPNATAPAAASSSPATGPGEGTAPPGGAAFPKLSGDITKRLDSAIQDVLKETGVPGVIAGVWANGKGSYVRAFGVSDKQSNAKMTSDLYMRIGSVTKTFTVTGLLRLVDQGKVKLDDPVGKYVDGVPDGDKITLRQLADMRSGLFNYSEDAGFDKALKENPERTFLPAELLAYAFQHPSNFSPGQRFQYSNTNTVLIGMVIEKVAKQPLAGYLQRNVITPARLGRTSFPKNSSLPDPHARGYTTDTVNGQEADATGWNPSWAWAAGAMISELRDLRTWAHTLATGTILSPASQKERLDFQPTGLPGTGYGLGIFDNHGWIGHNGSLPGYQAVVVYLPEAEATVVLLLNSDTAHQGSEPSTLFAQAVTKIVSPDHVYTLPAMSSTPPTPVPSSSPATATPPSPSASPSVVPPTSGPTVPVVPPTPGTT